MTRDPIRPEPPADAMLDFSAPLGWTHADTSTDDDRSADETAECVNHSPLNRF